MIKRKLNNISWERYSGLAASWDRELAGLSGSFYQSYGWGEVKKASGWEPIRLVAKVNGCIIALIAGLLKRKGPVAVFWVPGGPAGDIGVLNSTFHEVLINICQTRLLYCRIGSLRKEELVDIDCLTGEGWVRPKVQLSSGLTMHYSLADGEAERLEKVSGNWRHNLKRSMRYGLRIELCDSPKVAEISALYREMEGIKSLKVQHTDNELSQLFSNCSDNIILYQCRDEEGHLLAIRAAAYCGSSAMDLLAVAGARARRVYASHATLWALLNHCSQAGLTEYDLSGVDPIANKGVYDFKHGTGASLISCLGEWEWASMPFLRKIVNWKISRLV